MSEPFCCCPFCDASFTLKPGGYAYMRSQVVEHMSNCAGKPATMEKEEFWRVVDQVTPPDQMS